MKKLILVLLMGQSTAFATGFIPLSMQVFNQQQAPQLGQHQFGRAFQQGPPMLGMRPAQFSPVCAAPQTMYGAQQGQLPPHCMGQNQVLQAAIQGPSQLPMQLQAFGQPQFSPVPEASMHGLGMPTPGQTQIPNTPRFNGQQGFDLPQYQALPGFQQGNRAPALEGQTSLGR